MAVLCLGFLLFHMGFYVCRVIHVSLWWAWVFCSVYLLFGEKKSRKKFFMESLGSQVADLSCRKMVKQGSKALKVAKNDVITGLKFWLRCLISLDWIPQIR